MFMKLYNKKVLDLSENQSNVFLTFFDYFLGEGQYKLGGWEAPDQPPSPDKSRALYII